ncbi:DUF4139 domain-containing protein [soil metagenome]
MRLLLALLAGLVSLPVAAQTMVTSPGPDTTSVTVYRDPGRGAGGISADFPNGFALITETRRVALPAGHAVIRFEGVADGIIAVSALVTGLPGGVAQKNRDARLLSPAALMDGTLGNRVHLRRTNRATGAVSEQDAIIRSRPNGAVVLQTASGFEGLRCSGLPEALSYDAVPDGLSARPTLSVTTSSPAAATVDVTLTYLATGFDWGASYVARVALDGRSLDLFAWLTLANGNETGFADAQLLAVAGKLNRESDYDAPVEDAPSPRLNLQCWPMDTTSTPGPPPPAPPPAPMQEGLSDIVVTAQRVASPAMAVAVMAKQEELGDLKLYRVPLRVDVNAHAQKQVALLRKEKVPFYLVYTADVSPGDGQEESRPLVRTLRMQNTTKDGLGLPLPSGGVAVFQDAGGESLLLGDGQMRDHAIGEKVEIFAGESAQVRIAQARLIDAGKRADYRVALTNALDRPVQVEVKIHTDAAEMPRSRVKLSRRDGAWLWSVTVPANGTATLNYSMTTD